MQPEGSAHPGAGQQQGVARRPSAEAAPSARRAATTPGRMSSYTTVRSRQSRCQNAQHEPIAARIENRPSTTSGWVGKWGECRSCPVQETVSVSMRPAHLKAHVQLHSLHGGLDGNGRWRNICLGSRVGFQHTDDVKLRKRARQAAEVFTQRAARLCCETHIPVMPRGGARNISAHRSESPLQVRAQV